MAESRPCPECHAEADKQGRRFDGPSGAMWLGLHRKREHGVAGTTGPKGRGPATRGTRARVRADRAPKGPSKPRQPSLKADLRRVFKVLGTVVAVADPYCGTVLVEHSAGFCEALARLAEEDPRIAKWLRGLGKAGPYGALILAAGELAVPIAAHHGLVGPELTVLVGMTPPPTRKRGAESDAKAISGPPEGDGPGKIAPAATEPVHELGLPL